MSEQVLNAQLLWLVQASAWLLLSIGGMSTAAAQQYRFVSALEHSPACSRCCAQLESSDWSPSSDETSSVELGQPVPIPDGNSGVDLDWVCDRCGSCADYDALGDCEPLTLDWRQDLRSLPRIVLDDLRAVLETGPLFTLGVGGLTSYGVRVSWDDDVADYFRDRQRNDFNDWMAVLGGPGPQFGAWAGVYWMSLHCQDRELHDFSLALVSGWMISNSTNLGLKFVVNTDKPNDEPAGWPSGHVESTMLVAVMVDEYYGWKAALPLYGLVGAVAYARMSDEEHYLSDVVFGATLGYVVGRTVARRHQQTCFGGRLTAYADPGTRSRGIAWVRKF